MLNKNFSLNLQAGLDSEAVADPEDPFGGEDDCHDEVAALAKKFEEKYVSNILNNNIGVPKP